MAGIGSIQRAQSGRTPARLPAGGVMPSLAEIEGPDRSGEHDGEAAAAVDDLRLVDGSTHNLPVQLTSFVGRDAEMAQVRSLLADCRLVTLIGAGGVGKTRLALQVAVGVRAEYPAGVSLVDLAPLTDTAMIPVTVARALGLVDVPGRSAMATVTGFLGTRRALVVLDNCEHLLDGCARPAEELLRSCAGLEILATSREPVGLAGESTWLVPSLQLAGEAVELFADRGRQARPGFAVTADNGEAPGMRENGLRGRGGSRILQDMSIGLCWFARAGVLRALVAAARLLLAGGVRG